MADKENKTVSEQGRLEIKDGINFGIGFFIINLVGLAIVGVLGWLIFFAAKYFGVIF